ncbi:uncharacterized protein B0I36DRAFT_361742 [Microdochium trichocladiopsis]|uniref:Uncharacterized protein n=1 Tax=Microdochium trichocladiopsis TaxID=1682393 RepID=A0A9P8YBD7_9PEZI|nr:uncharacterized protein B0I36DRAFT_361742 [Microdochium trichocladiopsis]KAH7033008.1 hypothetical protein B0I36DRAFT_361742 [Microdochium trichocladiopsis]
MSRFFPHPAYAEDQPYAKTILTTHVLTRGVTTGTVIGGILFGSTALAAQLRARKTTSVRVPSTAPGAQRFLRGIGVSTLWTLGFVGVGMVARMWGRDDIEWRDRSWRLLENKGQLECDDWTYAGMAVGLAASAVMLSRGRLPPGALAGVGGANSSGAVRATEMLGTVSLGSFAGMLGYMGWRYGVHGGKFPSD